MLKSRHVETKQPAAGAPKKQSKGASKTPETNKKKPAGAGSSSFSTKPSIFASAVATRNKSQKETAGATSNVYNSVSSAATANFGKTQETGGGYATN